MNHQIYMIEDLRNGALIYFNAMGDLKEIREQIRKLIAERKEENIEH